ncbi:hypothetical protein GCM10010123_44830 [Pilimelia anulata]|uniref:Regulator of SigK n=1 Tax=Pilimelia anulata TaxID=53371 RepID=A0A8J3FES1_9ACTN|nr:anti-sigma factor [Pilimelia anulata]GGK09954.1 hypothetical protein GCM10010123_44830 [Pilimelia anulata]
MTDIHTLAGAYALDALDEPERAAFERHLRECPACATEVAELAEAATALAEPTWSVPPPGLRQRVLAAAATTRQEPPAVAARAGRRGAAARWQRFAAAAAAVGVCAAGAGLATYAWQRGELRDERAAAADARATADGVRAVLAAADARIRTGALVGGGRVTIVASAQRDRSVVVLDAPPAGERRVYQYWWITGAAPASAAVLGEGEHASTRLLPGARGVDVLGVTVEPAGGSATPTLPVRAGIPLT